MHVGHTRTSRALHCYILYKVIGTVIGTAVGVAVGVAADFAGVLQVLGRGFF